MRFNRLLIVLMFFAFNSFAQTNCPPNIGFEQGDFQNWECESGSIDTNGEITLSPTLPVPGRHTVIPATSVPDLDFYGQFPKNAPNGSGYSIMIGNEYAVRTGDNITKSQKADRVSYTFVVPNNQTDYSIIYNYAVVLFNPGVGNNPMSFHQEWEQPTFTAKVFNITDGNYIECGSFKFVSSSQIPGFTLSATGQQRGQEVYYKDWSPITLNLSGYAGKTISLEFTVNACSKDGGIHFGYAYIDVNENCESPITGNVNCNLPSLDLVAPLGFKEYYWYDSNFGQLLGTSNILKITPSPPANTRYAVKIVPYPGFGCLDTLYTTIKQGDEIRSFKVVDSLQKCSPEKADLTNASITAGSEPGLRYTYFTDAGATKFVPKASEIAESGIYYIKATNATGCYLIKPIKVILNTVSLLITNPLPVCEPGTIDITTAAITSGSDADLTYTYWKDIQAKNVLINPNAITVSGTYYIKATHNRYGCFTIKSVNVNFSRLVINNPPSCPPVDLTAASVTAGSSSGFTYTYWTDAAANNPLASPNAIRTSGTYYIKGTNIGCIKTLPVQVTVYSYPDSIDNPTPVVYPETVDLTLLVNTAYSLNYTYWSNKTATNALPNPTKIGVSGIYYIKASNTFDCDIIYPVKVTINPPPQPEILAFNTFTPNGDGINDFFHVTILGTVRVKSFKIFNRWGQLVFSTMEISNFWDGTIGGASQPVGTFYWVFDGLDEYRSQKVSKSGYITLIR